MRKIGVIYSGNEVHYNTFYEPKFQQYIHKLIYLPEFHNASLDELDVLIVPSQLHLPLLLKAAPKIHDFANQGKIVVAFGPQPQEWLPNQNWEERPTNFWWWLEKNAKSGLGTNLHEHDFFNYIPIGNAIWHQHGVFWPPDGCEKVITAEDGGAFLYIDRVSTKGTWIITTLDPDYHFGSYFMPATERFLEGFFPYLAIGKI